MRRSFFSPQLSQKISGLYRVSRFLLFHFLSCWAPLSKSTEVSYQPSFIQKLIKMILGKKDRKDCKCTVHSYLIFVISFTLAGFSKKQILYTKKRLKAPKTLKMSLKKSNICIFFTKSGKIYTWQNFFTQTCLWCLWQIWGMSWGCTGSECFNFDKCI